METFNRRKAISTTAVSCVLLFPESAWRLLIYTLLATAKFT